MKRIIILSVLVLVLISVSGYSTEQNFNYTGDGYYYNGTYNDNIYEANYNDYLLNFTSDDYVVLDDTEDDAQTSGIVVDGSYCFDEDWETACYVPSPYTSSIYEYYNKPSNIYGAFFRVKNSVSFTGDLYVGYVYCYNGIDDYIQIGSVWGIFYNFTKTFDIPSECLNNDTVKIKTTLDASTTEKVYYYEGEIGWRYYNVSDINASLNINGTYYTPTKTVDGNKINFNYSKLYPLFEYENNQTDFYWNYTILYQNGTSINDNTSNFTQNTTWSSHIGNITMNDHYLINDYIPLTVNYTNISSLETINGTFNFNNTNYTGHVFGNGMKTDNIYMPEITPPLEEFNVTSWLNVTYNGTSFIRENNPNYKTITVYTPTVTNCSSGTPSLILEAYDEADQSDTNFTGAIALTLYYTNNNFSYTKDYAFDYTTANHSQTICIYPNWASVKANATLDYTNTGYSQRHYFLSANTLSNDTQNIGLYLLNSSDSSNILFTIQDVQGSPAENVIVKVLKYYTGNNSYSEVAMGLTNELGTTPINLNMDDTWYSYVLIKDGTISRTFNKELIHDTSKILKLSETIIGDYFNYVGNVGYLCEVNSTNYIVCTLTDTSGTTLKSNLLVKRNFKSTWIDVCNNNATGSVTTLSCDISSYLGNNTLYYALSIYTDNSFSTLFSDYINISNDDVYGQVGVFIAIILLMGIVSAFAGVKDRPELIIASLLLGLIILTLLRFLVISFNVLIGIVIVGGIIIYLISKSRV